jgi:prolipoprotein diacylglyceryltransferase
MIYFESISDYFSWAIPILITTSKGGFYYNLFYFLAFLLATVWLVGEGYKRNFHLLTWVLVLAFTRIFFIIGSKVIAYSAADWNYVWQNFEFVPTSSKVVLGGLVLGTAAVVLMMRTFRLPLKALDAFAFVLPISLAVQRLGCFLLGCCYGRPTDLPMGVSYGHGTLPHFHQFQEGLIEASAIHSLPVHPFQLYEALNGILVFVILWRYRNSLRSPGSLLGLSLGLSAALRFCLEFFRDPNAHAMGGNLIGGLKIMQWLLIATVVLAIFWLVFNEKKKVTKEKYGDYPPVYPLRLAWVLMASVFITWALRGWFLPLELLALNIMLFPAIILALVHFFQASTYPRYRWLTSALLIIPVFLMSQTWEEKKNSAPDSVRLKSYDTFRKGFSTGTFLTRVSSVHPGPDDGCSDIQQVDFENKYWNLAAGYSRTEIKKNAVLTYGADVVGGKYRERSLDNTIINNYQLFALYPYVRYQQNWFGIGLGLHLGQNYWAEDFKDLPGGAAITTSIEKNNFHPSLYGRIGPEKIFFVDGGLANAFPRPFPGLRHEIAIGSGFGLPEGNRFRYGGTPFGKFFQAEILPHPSFLFSGSYVWEQTHYGGDNRNRQFLFGLQYRFNHKYQPLR